MTTLFSPIRLRDLEIPNRAWMSPMCTYSADPSPSAAGRPTDFHLAHYSARAAGGAGLVMVEATGVAPEGRISPFDLGIWDDAQTPDFARIASAIRAQGAVAGIQLAHAGRKASTGRPWEGGDWLSTEEYGWMPYGASPVAFPGGPVPHEMSREDIAAVVTSFAEAARRALEAGFQVAEVHAAHGYLLHSFLSPISNQRTDEYGGDLAGRARLALEVIDAVRAVWPQDAPVFLRISTTDWVEENPEDSRESWTYEQSAQLTAWAGEHGVDLVDASSGGTDIVPIPHEEDYQTRYAARLRTDTTVPVAAVGRVKNARRAAELLSNGEADAVFVGREMLRDPSWANHASRELGEAPRFLEQYAYAL
ncbi:NADH:flavin oxidoreductase/NADH oxidase [Brachybacterium alimentarium]|uniref:NADH:flavin oxidoreductase/NADH oxidase n=2 Tax=Brachybacterium alimentarium TaxID=47845 RepID=UPI000BB80929|nr:NADH:flavin oxidoreductase/NADH oxidase [Brachybacterium alimentarium]PCC33719.1 oxidoreductase [Brachybacterium alimentarium]RCS75075.1 NADH:flavin oxidoreductase/NADH oxidase [Brachybacterium alimentarium]RCS82275.1 NADH:flavin oxidoreductase/NADH oxidase [Brachybacterium alimentarium]